MATTEGMADGLEVGRRGWPIVNVVNEGKLVPEEIIFGLLSKRLEEGYQRGETGFILDGIPRTRIQAVSPVLFLEILDQIANIDLVVNLQCRDDCLAKKHFGADICSHCGKTFDSSNSESTSLNLCLATRTRHAQLKSSAVVDMKDSCMEKFHVYSEQF
ncbi:adenylate kinase [Musa troglodytarum]|uniref:adenylate kinase n=1 Tax=Musa troglodytarum TaxID=320322 RepID=A0A9E7IBE6_9LILI|nr:adenylate kinase [Musa troglodytarum]